MIIPPLRYLRPANLAEAVHWLSALDGSIVLGGGQTLLNALKLDLVAPEYLVDVHRLEELAGMTVATDGTVRIGAASTYAAIAADPGVQQAAPSVSTMAAGLVDRQVRNRGTIGGNVCLNDPTNNMPPRGRPHDPGRRVLPRHACYGAPSWRDPGRHRGASASRKLSRRPPPPPAGKGLLGGCALRRAPRRHRRLR